MYNPYQSFQPQQQVLQVNGRAGVDNLKLAPNSSVILMDSTAPIVYLCISDGIGNVSVTAYDIAVHQDKPPIDLNALEERINHIEKMMEESHGKSNVATTTEIIPVRTDKPDKEHL